MRANASKIDSFFHRFREDAAKRPPSAKLGGHYIQRTVIYPPQHAPAAQHAWSQPQSPVHAPVWQQPQSYVTQQHAGQLAGQSSPQHGGVDAPPRLETNADKTNMVRKYMAILVGIWFGKLNNELARQFRAAQLRQTQ
jgi:hypothetical protein